MFKKKQQEEEFYTYDLNEEDMCNEEENNNWDDYFNTEEDDYKDSIKEKKHKNKTHKVKDKKTKKTKKNKISPIIYFLILSGYLLFLLLGFIVTTYDIDDKPQVITIELREKRAEYKKIKKHYDRIYKIINQISNIDEEVSKGTSNESFNYATKYKDLIVVSKEIQSDIAGSVYKDEYKFMQEIGKAVSKSIIEYLTLMSNGMSSQNATYLTQAIKYQNNYQEQFVKYTNNIKQFKEVVDLS